MLLFQGGDDEYEYSPDHFEDPYSPEDLAAYAANKEARLEQAQAQAAAQQSDDKK